MTANAMKSDKERVIEAGMNAHISKPIDVKQMYSTLAQWLSSDSIIDENEHQDDMPDNDSYDANPVLKALAFTVIDKNKGLEVCNGNEQLYRRLLIRFIDGQADFKSQFNEAMDSEEWKTATRIAHTLKGSAGNIGAIPLYRSAEKLEQLTAQHAEQSAEQSVEANKDEIGAELREVQLALTAVIDDIKANDLVMIAAKENLSPDDRLYSADELNDKLQTLNALIEEFDTTAQDLALEIESSFVDIAAKTACSNIIKALNDYDFERAETQVTVLIDLNNKNIGD